MTFAFSAGTRSGSISDRSRVRSAIRLAFFAYAGSWASEWAYSLTVTPQPEAFMTIASTAPLCTIGHQASMFLRMWSNAPSRSPRCSRIAPQQPAPSATSVWMPAASSTRAVALLTLGIIAGWTQPSRSSTLRGCSRVGQRCALALGAGHLGLQRRRQRGAHGLAELHRGPERRRRQAFLQRPAQRALAGRPRHPLVDDAPADLDQVAVLHARRAGRLAVAAGQAAVEVKLRRPRRRVALEHLLDEIDPAARAVELVAEQLVGRAGRGAEAAVHALAQDRLGLGAVGGAGEFGSDVGLHVRFARPPEGPDAPPRGAANEESEGASSRSIVVTGPDRAGPD